MRLRRHRGPSVPPADTELPAVRVAEPEDLEQLDDIEAEADQLFARSGLGAMPPPALREDAVQLSVVFVAGRPAVGFARVDELDGLAHLDQLSVIPAMCGQGIGSALLRTAIDWATRRGYPAMTLTTFADVPWNAPVYLARGFVPIQDLTPGLVELRDWEHAIGLDAVAPRIVMRREL
jgi:GNAT superfamily N-acetyltransferase